MHGSFHICDRCDCRYSFVSWSDWYYDVAGTHLHISTRPGWCFGCESLRSVEALPSIDDCEREIAELSERRTALGARQAFPNALKLAQVKLEWRKQRHSPSRCIWCGGTDLLFLETESGNVLLPFVHPNCGGTIAFSSSFLGSASPTLFTPEGVRHQAKT